jgi:hypothetical protein
MNALNPMTNENPKNEFSQFLLDEYNHISSAHFEMTKQIANFIRFMWVFMLDCHGTIIIKLRAK